LYNAISHGYEIKVLNGYLFEKKLIFEEYVDFLYEMKLNSAKDTPDYIISKLLLNSLYGRFGMDPYLDNHMIMNEKQFIELQNDPKKAVTNITYLGNGKELVSFCDIPPFDVSSSYDNSKKGNGMNISVIISAAVTSYARIHMSHFKTLKDLTLFYSDTDSIDINKPLPDKYVGKEIGKMKLEHTFNDALFLAPKVYGGITNSYEFIKIKGLKNPISFDELKPILLKNKSIQLSQEK
jgi:hypothetical protein